MEEQSDSIQVRGFFRVAISEDDKIVGDSGWRKNVITNEGKRNYLARALGALAGSLQVSHFALGTGGVPATNATTLTGEVQKRTSVNAETSGSSAVQFTATFASAGAFVTATQNISNIGLFNSSSGGTLFAGNTYASSSVATNQNVNVTYVISFA
jgi:hypothetical protein